MRAQTDRFHIVGSTVPTTEARALSVAPREQLKIADAVVLTIAIPVMNSLEVLQWSSEMTGHHETMLQCVAGPGRLFLCHAEQRIVFVHTRQDVTLRSLNTTTDPCVVVSSALKTCGT